MTKRLVPVPVTATVVRVWDVANERDWQHCPWCGCRLVKEHNCKNKGRAA